MTIRWFLSGKVRHATDLHKHVRKLLNAQRDILSPQAVNGVQTALDDTQTALDSKVTVPALTQKN